MPLRVVLFDLFNTLVDLSADNLPRVTAGARVVPDSLGALHEQLKPHCALSLPDFARAMRKVDRSLRAARAEADRELPTLERFEALLKNLGITAPELAAQLTETHMRLLRAQVRAPDHHPEVLAKLRAQGLRIGVCSNFSHTQTALRVLEEAGLRWLCDAVVVSDSVSFRKPRAEIFQAALSALGATAEDALHVGDNLREDVAGAAPLGIRTAWITRRVENASRVLAEHRGPAPDVVIEDLREVIGLTTR